MSNIRLKIKKFIMDGKPEENELEDVKLGGSDWTLGAAWPPWDSQPGRDVYPEEMKYFGILSCEDESVRGDVESGGGEEHSTVVEGSGRVQDTLTDSDKVTAA